MTAPETFWLFVVGCLAAAVVLMVTLANVFTLVWWLVDRHQRRANAADRAVVAEAKARADARTLAEVEAWRAAIEREQKMREDAIAAELRADLDRWGR